MISIISGCFFSSCKDDDQNVNYLSYIQGEWACVGINGSYFATDSIIFYDFNSDATAELSYGGNMPGGGGMWNTYDNLEYSVDNQLLTINSTEGNAELIQKMNIYYVTDWLMICDVVSYSIDGVSQIARQQLHFERVPPMQFTNTILGIWQTPSQSQTSSVVYRDFEKGGSFDYYVYNKQTSQYTEEVVGHSNYVMYGNYIVMSYLDQVLGSMTYKCWKITTPPSTYVINWVNEAVNGNLVYQQLTSVEELPVAETM